MYRPNQILPPNRHPQEREAPHPVVAAALVEYGMASNGESRVWVVETGVFPNMFVEFDTQTERFSSATRIPSGARTVRHMDFHAATQAVWFGTDANTLGRAIVGGE